MRGCPEDTHAVLFALRRVILLRSYIMLRIVILSFGQFSANKITLNPQDSITLLSHDNNITLPQGRITLDKKINFNSALTHHPRCKC